MADPDRKAFLEKLKKVAPEYAKREKKDDEKKEKEEEENEWIKATQPTHIIGSN